MQIEKFDFKSLGAEKKPAGVATQDFASGLSALFATPSMVEDAKVEANIIDTPPAPPQAMQKEEPKPNLYTEKDLSETRSRGYEDGYAKGYNDAKTASDDLNKKIHDSLQAVSISIGKAFEDKQAAGLYEMQGVTEVISRIVKKVCATELESSSIGSIEKVIRSSFQMLFEEEKVVIYVNSDVLVEVSKYISDMARSEGFKGEVEVLGSDSVSPGNCSIEWQGGGVKSNKQEILAEIEKMCAECFGVAGVKDEVVV